MRTEVIDYLVGRLTVMPQVLSTLTITQMHAVVKFVMQLFSSDPYLLSC